LKFTLKRGGNLRNLKYSIQDAKVFLYDYCLDFQHIGRIDGLKLRKPRDSSCPVIEYQYGPNDRLEYLSARVYRHHLGTDKR
jgi:hypothetical protein